MKRHLWWRGIVNIYLSIYLSDLYNTFQSVMVAITVKIRKKKILEIYSKIFCI